MPKKSYEQLGYQAKQIRDEYLDRQNTAKRIGSLFEDIIDSILDGTLDKNLLNKVIRKDQDDTTSFIVTFLKGLLIGNNGSGITVLQDGTSQAVVDRLHVKIKAYFEELEVQRRSYVGGSQALTPSGMKCVKVEELDDCYRCYIKAEEDGVEVKNTFSVGTLAMMKECNIQVGVGHHVGNRYFWRKVTNIGADFIDLSKTICDPSVANDIPAAGDDIVGFGHDTDITRQGAIVMSSVDEKSPSIIFYQGINDFSLAGKEVIEMSFDKATGHAVVKIYGETYIGDRDRKSYFEFIPGVGAKLKGKLIITGKDGNDKEITEDDFNGGAAADDAKKAAEEAKKVADEAKKRLDEWAADGVISPLEKQGLKEEISRITSDHDNINANYAKYELGEPSAYNSAYNKYHAQLVVLSATKPETIPILTDFATNMEDYYTERTNALNAIVVVVEVGAENLLRNTGFTGDFKGLDLTADKVLSEDTALYSPPLEHWDGYADIISDDSSASGYAARLGGISQEVYLIPNESHVLSFKAKGANVTFSANGQTEQRSLNGSYQRLQLKFTSQSNNKVIFSGDSTICEIKLERGTVATDWCPHRKDRNEVADEFRKYWYLMDALRGTTEIDGGMILSTIIRLGMWQDGKLKQENAGISGIYNNDSDVAFYAGGSLKQAIDTVNLYRDDPLYVPSDDEMKNIANVVITHGGLAILSNVILRGWIFAEGGIFRGSVYADGGVFKNIKNPNGYFEIDEEGKLTAVDARFTGTLKRPWVSIMPQLIYTKVDPVTGQAIDVLGYAIPPSSYDRVRLIGLQPSEFYPTWGEEANGRDVMIWNDCGFTDGASHDIKVHIKEGYAIRDKGSVYTPADDYFFRGHTITSMTATSDSWIVTSIIDLNNTVK